MDEKQIILDYDEEEREIRRLVVDNVCQSAVYTDEAYRYQPCLSYTKKLLSVLKELPPFSTMLLLGGGGFDIPRICLHEFPELTIDVVEVDPEMIEIAREHFYLDDLLATGRLSIVEEDAAKALMNTFGRYDLIVNDLFIGMSPDLLMLSDSMVREIVRCLSDQGTYLINFITALVGSASMPLLLERDILLKFFEQVLVYPCPQGKSADELQNCIIAAREIKEGGDKSAMRPLEN